MRPPALLRPSGLGASFTTCQQVLTRRHGYSIPSHLADGRIFKRSIGTSGALGILDQLQSLTAQDPRGRIGFLPCNVTPDLVRDIYPEDAVSFSAHVIPTWTMLYQFDVISYLEHYGYGGRTISDQRIHFGTTITAVPPGHWCHGMLLEDDFVDLMGHARGQTSTTPVFLYAGIAGHLNPGELFANSFPALDDTLSSKLLDLIAIHGEGRRAEEDRYCHVSELAKVQPCYAVPLYRVVYKMKHRDGRIGYQDGFSASPTHSFRVFHENGRAYSHPDRWKVSRTGAFIWGKYQKKVVYQTTYPCVNNESIGNFLHSVTENVEPEWDDHRIIQHHAPGWSLFGLTPSVHSVLQAADRRVMGVASLGYSLMAMDDSVRHPRFRALVDQSKASLARTAPPHLRKRTVSPSSGPSIRRLPLRPTTGLRYSPPSRRAGPASPPPATQPAANARPRTTVPPKPHPKVKAWPKTEQAPPEVAVRTTTITRSQAIPDPLSWYKHLGIERPTVAFITTTNEAEWDDIIAEAKRSAARTKHPDMEGGSNAAMQDVNIAYEGLKTLSQRRKYNGGTNSWSLTL